MSIQSDTLLGMAQEVPLSVLIERVGCDDVADRAFVRGLAHWLHETSARLELDVVEELRLLDVVVTFKMTDRVKLVITGSPPGALPGDVTITIDESDFPHVTAYVLDSPKDEPYDYCTLDYALSGMPVRIRRGPFAGQEGVLVVAATIKGQPKHRVRLGTTVVTCDEDTLEPIA